MIKLTQEKIDLIKKLRAEHQTMPEIAKAVGCAESSVSKYLRPPARKILTFKKSPDKKYPQPIYIALIGVKETAGRSIEAIRGLVALRFESALEMAYQLKDLPADRFIHSTYRAYETEISVNETYVNPVTAFKMSYEATFQEPNATPSKTRRVYIHSYLKGGLKVKGHWRNIND